MSSEDLQFEDIVLLQLFKDQIMNYNLDQVKGEAISCCSTEGRILVLREIVIIEVCYNGQAHKVLSGDKVVTMVRVNSW